VLYNLLIVDDEEIIRHGLKTIVKWEQLGFIVVDCLSDGQDAIRYITQHPVDVILTDIKMTNIAGLELSKFVCENMPHIKVVILSGYKDFDFAKQAIGYNVTDYLLKPTRVAELNVIFEKIRARLEKESEESERMAEMLPILREEFLTEMLLGGLRDKDVITEKLKVLCLPADYDSVSCHMLKIRFQNISQFMKSTWVYGKTGFYNAVKNMFKADGYFDYYLIKHTTECYWLVAFERPREDGGREPLNKLVEAKKTMMLATLGICLHIELCESYENIYAINDQSLGTYFADTQEAIVQNIPNRRELGIMYEKQKLLVSYITEAKKEDSLRLLDAIFTDAENMEWHTAINFFLELFLSLGSKLKSIDMDTYYASSDLFNYQSILKLATVQDLKAHGHRILDVILNRPESAKAKYGNIVIEKAKEYINENYDKDITLEDVADCVYLSTVYLSRYFKQVTGENFINYLSKVRMEKAMELLNDSRYKVYEISQMVGYQSVKYFSGIFRRHTGLLPSDYRRQLIKGEDGSDDC